MATDWSRRRVGSVSKGALRPLRRGAMFIVRPEAGLLAFALTLLLRRHSDP
jgi:hypothetical protein